MGALERVRKWFEDQYDAQVAEMQAWWDGATKHGCFCGAGNRCDEPEDGLDGCCQAHDAAYGAANISADAMWDVNGFIAGKAADIALIECAGSNDSTDAEYQAHLIAMFSARVQIADVLETWTKQARQIEEEIDSFRRWLSEHAPSLRADASDVQQYREYLGGLGAESDEIESEIASASLSGDGGGGTALA
jgi:hypothetical protein